MPRPTAIEASLKFRRQLALEEAASAERMGNIWAGIYRRLRPQVESLADDVAAMEQPTKGKLTRLARMERILNQIREQATRFGQTVTTETDLIRNVATQQGIDDALKLMELSLPALPNQTKSQLTGSFTTLSVEAVESAAGILADDGLLMERLEDAYGDYVANQVQEHLLDGIAAGQNPRRIAAILQRNLQAALGSGLTSALTTIRTAQIKSYQVANHATYAANSRIVPKWIWFASLDSQTCMSCIAQHGTEHDVTEVLNDHHNGRCAPVPKTISYKQLGINLPDSVDRLESGEQWFNQQPETVQLQMMGRGKFEAWREGKFGFEELSSRYSDPVYGELLREATLKDLTSGRKPQIRTAAIRQAELQNIRASLYSNEYQTALGALEVTKRDGEFYDGELIDLQDKVDAEGTASEVALGRGLDPKKMTPQQWEKLGATIKKEAEQHLKTATLPGREAQANVVVGRHFIGGEKVEFMEVGGKTIERQWEGGSRKQAAAALVRINRRTKAEATDYMGEQLRRLGYPKRLIDKIDYTKRRRLLAELGNNQLQKGNVGGVARGLRQEILDSMTDKQKMQAKAVAYNPRAGVGLEKWTQYEMAMVKAGRENEIVYPADIHESSIPKFVTEPGNKRPTAEFSTDEEIPF